MTDFREAFIEHIDRTSATVAQVARETGVSKGQLDKLKQRRASSTNIEDAVLVAGFFGKTVEEFIGTKPDQSLMRILELMSQLSPDELRLFEAQLTGVLSARTQKR